MTKKFSIERQLLIGQTSIMMEKNCGKCQITALETAQLQKDLENMEQNLIAAVAQLSVREIEAKKLKQENADLKNQIQTTTVEVKGPVTGDLRMAKSRQTNPDADKTELTMQTLVPLPCEQKQHLLCKQRNAVLVCLELLGHMADSRL